MPSQIDKVFKDVFGYQPKKAGTALEKFVAITTRIRYKQGQVRHDAVLEGTYSGTAYQIDVLHQDEDSLSMGEAKDYSSGGKKVGRDDLQKMAGALCDLDYIENGVFWSATSYTKPARLYAKAALKTIGKSVTLMGLRPSTLEDESGFVRTVTVTGTHYFPLVDQFRLTVHWTSEGRDATLHNGHHSL
ncbi:restriction endonuclease [Pseudomonas putida]